MNLKGIIGAPWDQNSSGKVYQPKVSKFKDFIKYDTPRKKVFPEKILYQVFSNIGLILDDDFKLQYLSAGGYGHTFKFFHPIKKEWRVLKITSDEDEFNNSKHLSGRKIKGIVNIFECYPIKGIITKKSREPESNIYAIFMEYVKPIYDTEYNKLKKVIKWYEKNYDEDHLIVKHFMTYLNTEEWNELRSKDIWESPFSYIIGRIGFIREEIPDSLFDSRYTREDFYKLVDFVVETQKRLSRYKIPGMDIHMANIGKKDGEYKLFDMGVESKITHKDKDFIEIR